jgi:LL-diaminopimelate aminotransferase
MDAPKATMFVWAKIPKGFEDDVAFSKQLAQTTGVIVVPGSAFGECGKGYVRLALVQDAERIQLAAGRIGEFLANALS